MASTGDPIYGGYANQNTAFGVKIKPQTRNIDPGFDQSPRILPGVAHQPMDPGFAPPQFNYQGPDTAKPGITLLGGGRGGSTTSYTPRMAPSVLPTTRQPLPINRGLGQGWEARPPQLQPQFNQNPTYGRNPLQSGSGPYSMTPMPRATAGGTMNPSLSGMAGSPVSSPSIHPGDIPQTPVGTQQQSQTVPTGHGIPLDIRNAYEAWHNAGKDPGRFREIMAHFNVSPVDADKMHMQFSAIPESNDPRKIQSAADAGGDPSLKRAGVYDLPAGDGPHSGRRVVLGENRGFVRDLGPSMTPTNPTGYNALPEGQIVGEKPMTVAPGVSDDSYINRDLYQRRMADKKAADEAARPARAQVQADRRARDEEIVRSHGAGAQDAIFATDQIVKRQGGETTAEKIAGINAKGRVDAATALAQGRSQNQGQPKSTDPSANSRFNQDRIDERQARNMDQRVADADQAWFNSAVNSIVKNDGLPRAQAIDQAKKEFKDAHNYELGQHPKRSGQSAALAGQPGGGTTDQQMDSTPHQNTDPGFALRPGPGGKMYTKHSDGLWYPKE